MFIYVNIMHDGHFRPVHLQAWSYQSSKAPRPWRPQIWPMPPETTTSYDGLLGSWQSKAWINPVRSVPKNIKKPTPPSSAVESPLKSATSCRWESTKGCRTFSPVMWSKLWTKSKPRLRCLYATGDDWHLSSTRWSATFMLNPANLRQIHIRTCALHVSNANSHVPKALSRTW